MSAQKIAPYKLEIPRLELLAKHIVEGSLTGLHRSPFHGYSAEFREHKMYVAGDPVKFIDWKVLARSGKIYVKKFEEETNLRAQLILDSSSSMYYPPKERFDLDDLHKLGFAVVSAAVLTEIFRRQRDATGLSVFSNETEVNIPPKTNEAHRELIYATLERLLTKPGMPKITAAAESLHLIAESLKKRSLTILFTDLWIPPEQTESMLDALKHLRYKSAEMIVFHINDRKTELKFEFENRPVRFMDPETNDQISLLPGELKKNYLKKQREYFDRFKELFYGYGIDYVPVDVAQGYEAVLSAYMQKRKKIK